MRRVLTKNGWETQPGPGRISSVVSWFASVVVWTAIAVGASAVIAAVLGR